MPPKKGPRNSMPARINHANNTTLTPSRRSPRVPTLSKTSSESTQSLKPLDLSATPPESSFNIRFYNPHSPSTPSKSPLPRSKSRNDSSDAPLTRRRTFQARPSRLSTVYTPVVDTQDSSQSSRRTRRTAALETPQQDSDQDFSDPLGTTRWTFDQYMGKFGIKDMASKKAATSTSSNGARSSTRLRKPTTRAVEASELKGKLRQAKASTPAPVTEKAAKPVAWPKGIFKKGNQNSKGKKPKKIVRKKLEVNADKAGQKLYEVAAFALGADFLPTDIPKIIADARAAYEQRQANASSVTGQTANGVNGEVPPKEAAVEKVNEPEKEVSPTRTILKLKKSALPKLNVDGWTNAGRINDNGERVLLTPPDHSPYRSPHTYGDEELPFPPVRARSDRQAENDNTLGFPPLFGDRNIPLKVEENFAKEDITEEMAKAKARGQKRRQEAATVETPAKKPRRKRRRPGAETTVAEPSATPTAARSGNTQSPVRLKLKLNRPVAEEQPPAVHSATDRGSGQGHAQGSGRLKLKFMPAPVMNRQTPSVDGSTTNREQGVGNGQGSGQILRGNTRGSARGVGRGSARGNVRGTARGSDRGSARGRGRGAERGGDRGGRGEARGGDGGATRVHRGGITKPRGRGGRGGRGRGRGKASD